MTNQADAAFFAHSLREHKHRFDDVITAYWRDALPRARVTYGDPSAQTLQALISIMNRGGKRIRASLAEQAYRMFGGTDGQVIDRMGLSLEMIHAYLLITDDVSDQSDLRRGGPSAHRLLEDWHRKARLKGDTEHFGASMATLVAMTASHLAMSDIAALPITADRRAAALENLNRLLVTTCHGQINDIYNQAAAVHDIESVEHVLLWKTAYYSFINPLQFGAIIAGAPHEALTALADYGIAAGRAFQISDDIIGVFGDPDETGKSSLDDLREGKRTLLILKALELASPDDATFLDAQLGNLQLTEDNFKHAKQIIRDCGALDYATAELVASCDQAKQALQNEALPDSDSVRFLCGLADYLKERRS